MDYYGRAANLMQPQSVAVPTASYPPAQAMYAHAPSLSSLPEMYSLANHRRPFLDIATTNPYVERYHAEARDVPTWRNTSDIFSLSGSSPTFSSHETAVNSLLTLQNVVFRPSSNKSGSISGSSADSTNFDLSLHKSGDEAKSGDDKTYSGSSSPSNTDHSVQVQLPTGYPSLNPASSWDCLGTPANRAPFPTSTGGYVQIDQSMYPTCAPVRDNPYGMKASHAMPYSEFSGPFSRFTTGGDGTETSAREMIRRQFPPAGPGLVQVRHNKNRGVNRCNICNKTYARPSTLRIHLRTHSDEQPYRCQTCAKTFSQAANLTAHMRTHSGEKPFKCSICDRRFSQSSSVTTHMRTHTGARPYKCNFCEKAFADSSTLTKHRRVHTGEKPYRCKLCYQGFSQSGNLNRHMKVHDN